MKPGYKTTEFWLTFLAMVLGALMASGVAGDGVFSQVLGAAITVMAKLGYSIPRAGVKKIEAGASDE